MKDELHHRKQVQKKVVQSARKTENFESKHLNGSPDGSVPNLSKETIFIEKRETTNHRVPRLVGRPQYH